MYMLGDWPVDDKHADVLHWQSSEQYTPQHFVMDICSAQSKSDHNNAAIHCI